MITISGNHLSPYCLFGCCPTPGGSCVLTSACHSVQTTIQVEPHTLPTDTTALELKKWVEKRFGGPGCLPEDQVKLRVPRIPG
jgi:hypothetical protein